VPVSLSLSKSIGWLVCFSAFCTTEASFFGFATDIHEKHEDPSQCVGQNHQWLQGRGRNGKGDCRDQSHGFYPVVPDSRSGPKEEIFLEGDSQFPIPMRTSAAASAVAMAIAAETHNPSSGHGHHPLPKSIQENQNPNNNVKNNNTAIPITCKQIVITVGMTLLNNGNKNQVKVDAKQALTALCGPGSIGKSTLLHGMGQFLFEMTTAGHAQKAQEMLDFRWAGSPKCPVGFFNNPTASLSMLADPLPTTGLWTKQGRTTYANNDLAAGPTPPDRSLFDRLSEKHNASKRPRLC
jgi:hypothetical protein